MESLSNDLISLLCSSLFCPCFTNKSSEHTCEGLCFQGSADLVQGEDTRKDFGGGMCRSTNRIFAREARLYIKPSLLSRSGLQEARDTISLDACSAKPTVFRN